MTQIHGLTITVTTESHDIDVIRKVTEGSTRNAFTYRCGYPPTDERWLYEAASVWEDPDTGEIYELDERWTFGVEAVCVGPGCKACSTSPGGV